MRIPGKGDREQALANIAAVRRLHRSGVRQVRAG